MCNCKLLVRSRTGITQIHVPKLINPPESRQTLHLPTYPLTTRKGDSSVKATSIYRTLSLLSIPIPNPGSLCTQEYRNLLVTTGPLLLALRGIWTRRHRNWVTVYRRLEFIVARRTLPSDGEPGNPSSSLTLHQLPSSQEHSAVTSSLPPIAVRHYYPNIDNPRGTYGLRPLPSSGRRQTYSWMTTTC